MEMRQRRAAQEPASSSEPVSVIAQTIKRLDVYPKTLDDFKERTGSGAVVSLVSLSVIALLVISELSAYLTPTTVDHLYVDSSRGERIKVNLNITFPNMPCAGMSLVAMDVAGEQQIDVVSNIIKTRRTLAGAKIGIEMDEEHVRRKFAGQCGACFPQARQPLTRTPNPSLLLTLALTSAPLHLLTSSSPPHPKAEDLPEAPDKSQCCNSCADVKSVYQQKVRLT
jgi:hypothetical protein